MKKLSKLLEKPWAAYAFAACSAVLLFVVLNHIQQLFGYLQATLKFFSPVITGVIVAYLFNPVSDFFERKCLKWIKKKSLRHAWAVVMALICLILVLATLLVALIPSIVESIKKLSENWGSYAEKVNMLVLRLTLFLNDHNIKLDFLDGSVNVEKLIDTGINKLLDLAKNNSQSILSTVGSIGASVSNFVIGIVFGFCFLVAKDSLLRMFGQMRAAVFKKERIERNNELFSHCHRVFIRYVGCTLLDALIVGVAVLIFMLIMDMPYAPLIAAVVALTNIIPSFGPMIGAALGIFFLILDKPLNALMYFIFMGVLQSLDGMVIKPKLFKGSLGIPGVWTLVLLIIGGKIAGIAGIILAIPFAAIFVILYNETIAPRLKKRAEKINLRPEADEKPEAAAEEASE